LNDLIGELLEGGRVGLANAAMILVISPIAVGPQISQISPGSYYVGIARITQT
jgi:hypothetical protein